LRVAKQSAQRRTLTGSMPLACKKASFPIQGAAMTPPKTRPSSQNHGGRGRAATNDPPSLRQWQRLRLADYRLRQLGSGEMSANPGPCGRLLKPLYAQFTAPSRITPKRILADANCRGGMPRRTRQPFQVSGTPTLSFGIRVAAGQLCELTEYMDTALSSACCNRRRPKHERPKINGRLKRSSCSADGVGGSTVPRSISHPLA